MDDIAFWQQKIYQFFHDPPAKPYTWYPKTGGHAAIAKQLFKIFASAVKQEMKFYYPYPDWAAAGADRPVTSASRGKGSLQMRWYKEPLITHPLAKDFYLDVRRPGEETPDAQAEIRELILDEEAEVADQMGDILTDWQDPEMLKSAFIRSWRRFREELVDRGYGVEIGDPLWEEMPADSRCPDHSIWDHLHITTALCFLTKKNVPEHQQPWLFRFSLGPVSRFIKESRTSRDLWASSFILSDLAWHAMEPIVEQYGPDCIIYPDLRRNPRADVWLAANHPDSLQENSNPLTHASVLPNAFTAILPRGGGNQAHLVPIEEMAKRAEKNVADRWHELEDIVYRWFERIAGNGPWREMWKRQHENVVYATWSAVEWKKPIPVKYPESLKGRALPAQRPDFRKPPLATPKEIDKDKQAILERRGRMMPWMPMDVWSRYEWARDVYGQTNLNYLQNERGFDYAATHHQLGVRHKLRKATAPDPLNTSEGGEKCTLCGRRQALVNGSGTGTERLDLSRRATKKFWSHEKLDPDRSGSERLCAVCTMKRFLVEAGNDPENQRVTGINPVWAGQKTPYQDIVYDNNKVRLPFPSTAAIAAQRFLKDIATDPEMNDSLNAVVQAYKRTGMPRTNFPGALPKLAGIQSTAAAEFLKIDPQYALFPEAIQGKASLLDKQDRAREDLKKLGTAVRELRKKARSRGKDRPQNPGTHLAVICMDGDHMGRLLMGDPEKIGACFKDIIHPKTVEDMVKKDYFINTGWHDLLHANRLIGPSLHAYISRALAGFSHTIVPWVVEHEFSGRLVYAGGDDVLCMAPAAEALFLAARLQQLFSAAWVIDTDYQEDPWFWRQKKWNGQVDQQKARRRFAIPVRPEPDKPIQLPITNSNLLEPHSAGTAISQGEVSGPLLPMLGPSNSLSAGIVYSHFKTPMSAMLELAEHLLENLAKKKMKRNAVAMSHLSRNGMKSEFALKWKDAADHTISAHQKMSDVTKAFKSGDLPSRLPYKLREIMPVADAAMENIKKDNAASDEEKTNTMARLLNGFLSAAIDSTPDADAKESKKRLLESVFTIWKAGIDQHDGDPERAVEGLLLARAMSTFSGGDL